MRRPACRPTLLAALLLLMAASPAAAQTFESATTPRAIPDKAPGFADTITVSGGPTAIYSLLVTLNITHTFDQDLHIFLVPPGVVWAPPYYNGNVPVAAIALIEAAGGSGDNFTNTRFTAKIDPIWTATKTVAAGAAPFNDIFWPIDFVELAAYYGTNANGDWQLVVFDTGTGDTGTLDSWSLTFLSDTDADIDVQRPAGISIADGGLDAVTGLFEAGVPVALTYTIENFGVNDALNLTSAALVDIPGAAQVNCTATLSALPTTPVAPSSTTTFTVTVTPTAVGPFSFDLVIPSDDPDESPYAITVEGVATDPLVGTYLISNDASESPDFASLGEAFNALEQHGMIGSVVFEISAGLGPYTSDASYLLGDTPVLGASPMNTLTIRAQGSERPVITGSGAAAEVYAALGTLAIRDVPYVSIDGLDLDGGLDFGLALIDGGAGTMRGVAVTRCRLHGVAAGGGLWVIGAGFPIDSVTLEHNMIWDVAVGDSSFAAGAGNGAIGIYNVGADTVVRHNTIVVNTGGSGGALIATAGSGAALAEVSYNILVAANTGAAIYDLATVMTAADENLTFLTGGAGPFAAGHPTLADWQTATSLDLGSAAANPLLVSIAHPGEDLHLTPASAAAIDAATGSDAPFDIDGDARPVGAAADIGADEYADAPIIAVSSSQGAVADGGTLTVTEGDALADLQLVLTATKLNAAPGFVLVTLVTPSDALTGFVQSEWDAAAAAASVSAAPLTGTFAAPGPLDVVVSADDGVGGLDLFTFTIVVQARGNEPPALVVTAGEITLTDGGTVQVAFDTTLTGLDLAFTATDPNPGDTLTISATIDDPAAITGFVADEWGASGTGGSVEASPSSGRFATPGTMMVSLEVSDGQGATASFAFALQVGDSANTAPVLAEPAVTGDAALTGSAPRFEARLELGGDLGVEFSALDGNPDDELSLTIARTGGSLSVAEAGFAQTLPLTAAPATSPATSSLSGTATKIGTIELTVTVSDGNGGSDSYVVVVTIESSVIDDGCGCQASTPGAGGAQGLLLLLAAFAAVRPRRRRRGEVPLAQGASPRSHHEH